MGRFKLIIAAVTTACLVVATPSKGADGEKPPSTLTQRMLEAVLTDLAKRLINGSVDTLIRMTCTDPLFRARVVSGVAQLMPASKALGPNLENTILTTFNCSAAATAALQVQPPQQVAIATDRQPPQVQQPPIQPVLSATEPMDLVANAIMGALENDGLAADRAIARLDSLEKPQRASSRAQARNLNDVGIQSLKRSDYAEAERMFIAGAQLDPGDEEILRRF